MMLNRFAAAEVEELVREINEQKPGAERDFWPAVFEFFADLWKNRTFSGKETLNLIFHLIMLNFNYFRKLYDFLSTVLTRK